MMKVILDPFRNREHQNPIKPRINIKRSSSFQVIKNSKSLDSIMQDSRLSIHLNDGTTFLDAIGNDQPCMLLTHKMFNPLREVAKPFYEELVDVGIYHKSMESLFDMINEINEDVGSWWYRDDVVLAKKQFCKQFARRSKTPIKDIHDIIIST